MAPEVGRGVVNGVPAFWGAAPGNTIGALVFRIGHADETLIRRGVTHLIEHLALHRFDSRTLTFNGFVDLTTTGFHCQGTPEQVGAFLTEVCRSLADLPFDRMEKEAQVLRAEAAQRRRSSVSLSLLLRCGPVGFGLAEHEELFLHQPDHAVVDEWRRRHFTRQNAVVVLSTLPPPNLDLSALPDGARVPAPPYLPVAQDYPAWNSIAATTVSLSAVVPRSVAATATMHIVASILRRRLREELALSYNVGVDTQYMSGTHAHQTLFADCRPEDAPEVGAWIRTELSRIIHDGCPPSELDDYRAMGKRFEDQPGAALANANFFASEWLYKGEYTTAAQIDDELQLLRTEQIDEIVARFADTCLWLVPERTAFTDRRMHLIRQWSTDVVSGTTHVHTAPDNTTWLQVAPEGLSLAVPDRGYITLWFDRLAACKTWTDGARTLFGLDGFSYTVHPADWSNGQAVIDVIDQHVSPAIRVVSSDPLRRQ